jgi:Ca2+-binding EF-hand superfamily protein
VELKYGLRNYGTDLSDAELEDVMAYFDRDRNGLIDFDEFLRGMRGEMNARRCGMVDLAFDVLDRTGDGLVTIDDLIDTYDVSWHPAVRDGSMSKEQALREFLGQWDRREKDGIVTREEFHDYYQVSRPHVNCHIHQVYSSFR